MDGSDYFALAGDDGGHYRCRLLSCFQLGSKEYALLLREGDEGGSTSVLMELLQSGSDEATFRPIEDDEEFRRVVAYVREIASPTCPVEPEDN